MAVRAALITPFAFPSVRGNAITVERIARGLRGRGVELRVWDLSVAPDATVEAEVAAFRPSVVHAFHAFRAGPLAIRLARRAEIPLLVTITGTDVNHDLFDPERAPLVRRVLEGAASVTVFHDSVAARIIGALPDVAARLSVVPQSVSLPPEPPDLSPGPPLGGAGPRMLFPGGIRPVKNPRFPLPPLDGVAPRFPGFEFTYVGPILDDGEGHALLQALRDRPWARYLGAVAHQRMRGLLEAADVVLNCSISEGGMANSVLEALALGRAVLASDIEGNRSLVEDGVTGLLFSSPEKFADQAQRLLGDPDLRRRLGAAGRRRVTTRFSPERELDGYVALYGRLAPALHDA